MLSSLSVRVFLNDDERVVEWDRINVKKLLLTRKTQACMGVCMYCEMERRIQYLRSIGKTGPGGGSLKDHSRSHLGLGTRPESYMYSIHSSMPSYHFFFSANRSRGHGSRRNEVGK